MPQIVSFNAENFFAAISNRYCGATTAKRNACARHIFTHLKLQAATAILIEENYIDGDYVDDYAMYYVKCFERYDIRCKRVHFFASRKPALSPKEFEKIACGEINGPDLETFRASYLGFVVARPLPLAIIGRTALKPLDPVTDIRHFSLVPVRANLFGIDLQIDSLAFQQQDKVVAACGTVALWSALQKSNHLFNTATPRPAAISIAANLVVGQRRSLPSHALTIEQMCSAVKHVGLEPEVIDLRNELPLRAILYAYLRSGLSPVIVAQVGNYPDLHAIAINGYLLDEDRTVSGNVSTTPGTLSMLSDKIDAFFGHDDQIGPFTEHRISPESAEKRNPAAFSSNWKTEDGEPCRIFPLAVLIPVYNKIRLNYTHIETWVNKLNAATQPILNNIPHVWDLYLTSTTEHKLALRREDAPLPIRRAVILRQHPRFLWRAVLYIEQKPALELLFDATDIPRTFPGYCMVWYDANFRKEFGSIITSDELREQTRTNLSEKFHDFLSSATQTQVYFHNAESP